MKMKRKLYCVEYYVSRLCIFYHKGKALQSKEKSWENVQSLCVDNQMNKKGIEFDGKKLEIEM